jgi:hypothetical protein
MYDCTVDLEEMAALEVVFAAAGATPLEKRPLPPAAAAFFTGAFFAGARTLRFGAARALPVNISGELTRAAAGACGMKWPAWKAADEAMNETASILTYKPGRHERRGCQRGASASQAQGMQFRAFESVCNAVTQRLHERPRLPKAQVQHMMPTAARVHTDACGFPLRAPAQSRATAARRIGGQRRPHLFVRDISGAL